MTGSPYELLTTGDDVVRYLEGRGFLPRVADRAGDVEVTEVTAGNMNRVFIARGPRGTIAVKQAPPWVHVAGPDWPADPGRIESEFRAYELLRDLVPGSIPVVETVDLDRYVLVMEDLSDLRVLRDALVDQVRDAAAGRDPVPVDFRELGRVVGEFVGELSFATSLAGMDTDAHIALVLRARNPDLCAMTDAVVLDEPYREHEHNHFLPELDSEVRSLYTDRAVLSAVQDLRRVFADRAEALIHGDLHSGSIMLGPRDGRQVVKVFDPEFAFVGPIGMDLGLFWANLAAASYAADAVGAHRLAEDRASAVAESWRAFTEVITRRWPGRHGSPDGLGLDGWLERVQQDAWGFAGVEAIRRVAGYSHASDLTTLQEGPSLIGHRRLLLTARGWLVHRADSTGLLASPAPDRVPLDPSEPRRTP